VFECESQGVTPLAVRETSGFKINPEDFKSDLSLEEERGWHKMDVRWLVTNKTVGSTMTVVGLTKMPPGVKSKHAIHRHPNAEEWEFIIEGVGLKHVAEDSFLLRAGELAFVPRDVYHGLENASETETLVTIWGYCGASSLEEAGYVILEEATEATTKLNSK
jgi:oxalate decarboxylase/phosphoglucose isomerase-like protein (cupin superfamily)